MVTVDVIAFIILFTTNIKHASQFVPYFVPYQHSLLLKSGLRAHLEIEIE